MPGTPSTHRQRLNLGGNVGLGLSNVTSGLHLGTPTIARISPGRGSSRIGGQPSNGFAGYGMSAGLKVSHTPTQGHRLQTRAQPGPRGMASDRINLPGADIYHSGSETSFNILWQQDVWSRIWLQWWRAVLLTTFLYPTMPIWLYASTLLERHLTNHITSCIL